MRLLLILALALPLLFAANLSAVTLMWDANNETNIGGYKVYVGASSRSYSTNWTTTNTVFTVTNVPVNRGSNFFAVTAFDTDGLESEYSDEVSGVFTNRPSRVTGVRLAPVLTAQSAPTVNGPWSPEVQLVELELTLSRFYRLAIAMPESSSLMPAKRWMQPTAGPKSGKVPAIPKRPRQGLPFPPG